MAQLRFGPDEQMEMVGNKTKRNETQCRRLCVSVCLCVCVCQYWRTWTWDIGDGRPSRFSCPRSVDNSDCSTSDTPLLEIISTDAIPSFQVAHQSAKCLNGNDGDRDSADRIKRPLIHDQSAILTLLRQLVAIHVVLSSWTQKTLDRTDKELPIDVQQHEIPRCCSLKKILVHLP